MILVLRKLTLLFKFDPSIASWKNCDDDNLPLLFFCESWFTDICLGEATTGRLWLQPQGHPPVNLPLLTQASENDLGTFRQRRTNTMVNLPLLTQVQNQSYSHKRNRRTDNLNNLPPAGDEVTSHSRSETAKKYKGISSSTRKGSADFSVEAILDKPAMIEGASSSKEDTQVSDIPLEEVELEVAKFQAVNHYWYYF
ncbi:hypothetical protein Tco_1172322 [Tanacetum coccineum]